MLRQKIYNTLFIALLLGSTVAFAQQTMTLTDTLKQELIRQIEVISELDQRYRSILALGTLDETLLEKDRQLRQTASLEEYLAFKQTAPQTLTDAQRDSLWEMQHELDYQNYKEVRAIIQQYGYPSKDRLGLEEDKLFAVFLHPPIEIAPEDYLKEMTTLLLPEVKANRMEAKAFAGFYDNIKAKILKEPQLYGTNKSFDPATMSMSPPLIENIEATNEARRAIGLEALQEGDYQLAEN